MALTAKKVYAILKRQISDMEAKLNSPVRYRGTVATADLLPLNPDIGDMYNIESKSVYGEAGMNVAWNGVVWDTMGAPIDMSLYLTKEEAEAVIQRLVTEYFEKNPVKPGATTEQAQQIEQNKTDIASLQTKTSSLKEDKITKPAEVPTIGKILRVKSVNEDGTFVCEWADGGSNLDVRINGESIVQDGVAEIPIAVGNALSNIATAGLAQIKPHGMGGISVSTTDKTLITAKALNEHIDSRTASDYLDGGTSGNNHSRPIVPANLDYAVKAAMCDGKGAAWTVDEQAAARERIGSWTGDWEIIMDETLAEMTQAISFEVPDDTKEMICYFKSGVATENIPVYLRTFIEGSTTDESYASFGGSLSDNEISIGCQKIQFLNSQYGFIEYSYLSHLAPSTTDNVQRSGKTTVLRIDSKRFAFHSTNKNAGYPVETRLLVLVRR